MWDVFANQSEKFDSFASHSLLSLPRDHSFITKALIGEEGVSESGNSAKILPFCSKKFVAPKR